MSITSQQAGADQTKPVAPNSGGQANSGVRVQMTNETSAQNNAATAPDAQAGLGTSPSVTARVQREAAVLRNALAFTQVVGVLMRSAHYKQYTLADLEWLVVPPIMAGQFRIGEVKPDQNKGAALPVAVVLWASVSAEVDKRLMEADSVSFKLKPEEWKSGDIPWLVHAAGETRFVRHVVEQLMKTTFKGREVKVLARDKDGKPKVHTLSDTAPAPSA